MTGRVISEPIPVSIDHEGRTVNGEYAIERAGDDRRYLIVKSRRLGERRGLLGELNPAWLAEDLLRALVRQFP